MSAINFNPDQRNLLLALLWKSRLTSCKREILGEVVENATHSFPEAKEWSEFSRKEAQGYSELLSNIIHQTLRSDNNLLSTSEDGNLEVGQDTLGLYGESLYERLSPELQMQVIVLALQLINKHH